MKTFEKLAELIINHSDMNPAPSADELITFIKQTINSTPQL